ncbi:VanY-A/VanY-F/VanY-M family D-Ala-D-Ala carboxypeptidase [Heyndrickxia vini]|uniref:VanY-A/VanY-F/VanY-M family D-Ala-D-Ala carboxypeptidase n=1 Tax=Heyndrickxia vini TaxID=1476025 RepID=A0ABX7DZI6_9BACI|nr:VanY-A/VanY-F/VanY-M family D-Ala-D-Ala carboxypeptidase [Heyndrickxia vini]QQZ08687.1 VanY-A/VanY-F/VanY-M family D-Ala-D-Ala carboxypeptidase [Heyndrickxia vini]
MKKWGFLLIFLILLGVTAFKIVPFFQDEEDILITDYENDKVKYNKASENIQTVEISAEQIYQGNLLLVNSKYPVHPKSIKSDVVNLSTHNKLVKGYSLFDNKTYLSEDLARKFSDMVLDAEENKEFNFFITSGFRNFDEQNKLYQEMGSNRALPAGYSEHNLGLSLDVGTTHMKMEKAPEGKWIENNAWKYGFILRYPGDKTDITGIQNEPWHIRYVGLPHSAIMKEKNFVLEEYLDYLKEEKKVSVKVDGKKYNVSYYPYSENMTINIPENHKYEISGNNIDGVIVTFYES